GRLLLAALDGVGDLGHLLLQVEGVADLLEPQVLVVQLLAEIGLGVEVLELEVLELRAEFLADVLLGALRELADLADRARHVLDDLGELVRAEHEHGEDDERHQLERTYVIEHLFNDIGALELVTLIILAVLVFGPDKLPKVIQDVTRTIRKIREFSESAKQDIREELGPEFKDFEFEDLNPKTYLRKQLDNEDLGLKEIRNTFDLKKEMAEVSDAVQGREQE